jgi:hypothetical protein
MAQKPSVGTTPPEVPPEMPQKGQPFIRSCPCLLSIAGANSSFLDHPIYFQRRINPNTPRRKRWGRCAP